MKKLPIITVVIVAVSLAGGFWGGYIVGLAHKVENQKVSNNLNCDNYKIYPEKYVDKVPNECLSQYFEHKETVRKEAIEKQRNAITGNKGD